MVTLFATVSKYPHEMTQAKVAKEDCPLKFSCPKIKTDKEIILLRSKMI